MKIEIGKKFHSLIVSKNFQYLHYCMDKVTIDDLSSIGYQMSLIIKKLLYFIILDYTLEIMLSKF